MTQGPVDSRSEPIPAVLAVIDVLVLGPIGLGASVVTDAPAALKRVRQELDNARFLGRLTLNRSISELRQRLDDGPAATPPATPGRHTTTAPLADPRRTPGTTGVPDVGDLALPDYDHLPAIDIVAKLAQLSAAERSVIETYENANRRRRTVLGKLAQLSDVG